MTIEVGDRMPAATFKTMTGEGLKDMTTDEVFTGKKVVLFAVPGAFTPTCSDRHLPGYLELAGEIRAKGVDTIACVAVNDAFVMHAWAKARRVDNDILMLSDGNGTFTRALGLELDASRFGMGPRSRRYGAIVDNGVFRLINVEPAGDVGVSSAETLLAAL